MSRKSMIALAALTAAAAAALSSTGASAHAEGYHRIADQPDIEVGNALVCDTQEQVERYIARYKGDQEAAVRAVNVEERDPTACGFTSVAYIRGRHVASVSKGDMAFEIVRILVIGVDGDDGTRPVNPSVYFTAFGVTEYGV